MVDGMRGFNILIVFFIRGLSDMIQLLAIIGCWPSLPHLTRN